MSRIQPWSAAKFGAIVGLALGALLGALAAAVYGSVATELTYAGYEVGSVGWAGVVLVALLGSMFLACAFPCVALLYNLASRVGAALVVDLTVAGTQGDEHSTKVRNEPSKADATAPLLDQPFFDAE